MKKVKEFNPHAINDHCIRHDKWTAFVTWNGLDLQEYGETRRNANYFLLQRHTKFLGITEEQIPDMLKQIGFY